MPFTHLLLTLLVVIAWGINFIFVKLSLEVFPPLLLCALRFMLASIPVIFFIKPPNISFKIVALYGLIMFALQFSLLFIGMKAGTTAGMASLIMQSQALFSIMLAVMVLNEKFTASQILGAIISFSGIVMVGFHRDGSVSMLGFICILCAAISWGIGNLITKKMNRINMFSLVIWGSFIASMPMLILSILFEGPTMISSSLHHITWLASMSLLYIVCVSTWVGYGVWNWLVGRYPVGVIAPFTVLVPVVGMLSSVLFLKESMQPWKLSAATLVIIGLYINYMGPRLFKPKPQQVAY